ALPEEQNEALFRESSRTPGRRQREPDSSRVPTEGPRATLGLPQQARRPERILAEACGHPIHRPREALPTRGVRLQQRELAGRGRGEPPHRGPDETTRLSERDPLRQR